MHWSLPGEDEIEPWDILQNFYHCFCHLSICHLTKKLSFTIIKNHVEYELIQTAWYSMMIVLDSLCSNTRDHWNYHQLFVWGLIVTMDSLKMILRLWLCGANQYLCQVENKRGSGMQSDLDLTFLFWPNENPLLFPLCHH